MAGGGSRAFWRRGSPPRERDRDKRPATGERRRKRRWEEGDDDLRGSGLLLLFEWPTTTGEAEAREAVASIHPGSGAGLLRGRLRKEEAGMRMRLAMGDVVVWMDRLKTVGIGRR